MLTSAFSGVKRFFVHQTFDFYILPREWLRELSLTSKDYYFIK